jgi:hypothetical protein
MTDRYIPTTAFRSAISLFSKLMELPSSVVLNTNGVAKEFTVFHRLELVNYYSEDTTVELNPNASLSITSYAVEAVPSSEYPWTEGQAEINPEYEFAKKAIFWAGAPTKVFRDYTALSDKKYGVLGWCGSFERDLFLPAFLIDTTAPIFNMSIRLDMLARLAAPDTSQTPRTFVGSVDLDGHFTDASKTNGKQPQLADSNPIVVEQTGNTPAVWSSARPQPNVIHKVLTGIANLAQPQQQVPGAA